MQNRGQVLVGAFLVLLGARFSAGQRVEDQLLGYLLSRRV